MIVKYKKRLTEMQTGRGRPQQSALYAIHPAKVNWRKPANLRKHI